MVAPELETVCSGSGFGLGSGRLKQQQQRAMTKEAVNREGGERGEDDEEQLCMDKIKQGSCLSTKEEDDELTSLPDNTGNCEHQLVDNNNSSKEERDADGVKENGYKNEDDQDEDEQHRHQNHQDDFSLRKQHVEGNKEAFKQSYSKQFNRLDPNRRSFSTPAVNAANTIHQTSTKQSTTTATTTTTSCDSSNTKTTIKATNKLPSQIEKRTTLIPSKLRRRTALGLISFGSSNYKVAVAHQNQQQAPVSSTTSGQKSSGSNWRSWFSSSSNSSGNSSSSSPSSSSSSKNEQTQAKSPFSSSSFSSSTSSPSYSSPLSTTATTTTTTTSTSPSGKRSLLRNLRPQTLMSQAITTTSTSNSVVGNKSKQEAAHLSAPNESFEIVQEQRTEFDHQKEQQVVVKLDTQNTKSSNQQQEATNSRETRTTATATDGKQDDMLTKRLSSKLNKNNNSNQSELIISRQQQQQQQQQQQMVTNKQQQQQPQNFEQKLPRSEAIISTTNKNMSPPTTTIITKLSCEQKPQTQVSLVDKLIDSELEWRQLIREANGGESSLSKLNELQIKRQEVIHELVQTERHHCLTLALMRQVYLAGLKQLNESRSMREIQAATKSNNGNKGNIIQQQLLLDQQQYQQQQNHHHVVTALTSSDHIDLERLFPALEDLIQAHELFFAHLRLRLVESCQLKAPKSCQDADPADNKPLIGLVGPLGDLLCDQFRLQRPITKTTDSSNTNNNNQSAPVGSTGNISNNNNNNKLTATTNNSNKNKCNSLSNVAKFEPGNGHKLLQAYSKFCGQHYDSSRYYKHLMQTDKGFKQFIEMCNKQNPACRQRGIPECNLLVTQRLTKYPLLIEQLIKTSKDDPHEEAKLKDALKECKALLAELNNQLARKESFERLLDIYAQFCPKSYTIYNRHFKFTKHDLLQHKRLRQLLHSDSQIRIWSATRRKLFQILCLILNDIVVFLKIESSSLPSNSSATGSSTTAISASVDSTAQGVAQSQASTQNQHNFLFHAPNNQHLFQSASNSNETNSGSLFGDLFNSDTHHSQASYCALINVFAQALHTSGAQSLNNNGNSNASNNNNNSGSNNNGSGQHSNTGTAPSSLISHQSQACSTASTSNGINVKYYFANIDNKSSVISLSKLLIREKAVQDGEPRIYLISSNPSQPEMYELAFLSKRHQMSFVDKLKSCIEQHHKNRSLDHDLVDEDELDFIHGTNLSLYGGNHDCEGNVEEDDDDDEGEVEEEDDEEEEEEEDEDDDEEDDFGEDYNDEDDEVDIGVGNANSYDESIENAADTSRSDIADDTTASCRHGNGGQHCCAKTQPQDNKNRHLHLFRGRRRRGRHCRHLEPTTACGKTDCQVKPYTKELNTRSGVTSCALEGTESEFEHLDIEQDVVYPPEDRLAEDEERQHHHNHNHRHRLRNEESNGSLLNVAQDGDQSGTNSRVAHQSNELSDHGGTCQTVGVVRKEKDQEEEGEKEVNGEFNGDDNDSADEPESNESGLSERAKDSLDESTSAMNSLSKQKLRGPRRRRVQRPRQVSNQSSSSSEAATSHRQVIKLISSQQQQQQQDSSGTCCLDNGDKSPLDKDEEKVLDEGVNDEEEFDSGRGHDDSSSAASTSSNSLNSRTDGSRDIVGRNKGCSKMVAAVQTLVDGTNTKENSTTDMLVQTKEKQQEQQRNSSSNTNEGKRDKLLDLKLLKGSISLSTSSITSTLMSSITGSNESSNNNNSAMSMTSATTMGNQADPQQQRQPNQQQQQVKDKSMTTTAAVSKATTTTTVTANNSSSCASSTASSAESSLSTGGGQKVGQKSNLVKCSSILNKSSCSFMKQRKLSTVSTMSSQLKLINKLKSSCCEQAYQSRNQYVCMNCLSCRQQQQQSRELLLQDGNGNGNGNGNCNVINFVQMNNSNSTTTATTTPACCSPGCLSQQSTLNKQLRQQLRRSSFIPEQKLEELRDLRIQLDKDKQEWQEKFDKMQEQLLNERRELDLAREKLKQDRQQVANEREQLYRKLDVLKEKGILLSPSHKVIITTPELRIFPPNNDQNQQQQQQQQQNIINNQRYPLKKLNNNTSNSPTSSIRIPYHQTSQSKQQQYQHHYQQQQQHSINHYSVNMSPNTDISNSIIGNQNQSTNLFIQSSATACKVPLHLSENPTTNRSSLSQLMLNNSRTTTSLIGGLLGAVQSNTNKPNSTNIESHLI